MVTLVVTTVPIGCAAFMYKYDVFVSYKREPADKQLVTPWLCAVLDRIEYWLRQELGGRDIKVFFDVDSIDVGAEWPAVLRDALLRSRCLLAIWSPEYFRSPWCMTEWQSFLIRETRLREQQEVGRRLVFPIKVHDGVWYPPKAQDTQQFDLRQFAATTPAFWQSARADELDQLIMKKLAPDLARLIAEAPDFEADWPIADAAPLPTPTSVGMVRL